LKVLSREEASGETGLCVEEFLGSGCLSLEGVRDLLSRLWRRKRALGDFGLAVAELFVLALLMSVADHAEHGVFLLSFRGWS
jgi:hypothetical protein